MRRSAPWQPQYDVRPDGRRFLGLRLEHAETPITVVANWLSAERARETRR